MPARLVPAFALALAAGPAVAECASDARIAGFVADWKAKQPTEALSAGGSMEDALCTQGKLVSRLAFSEGRPVGYKAGLTSKPAQERFGVSEPVRGVLLSGMLLDDGATVPAAFGARPLFEADLLLVVGGAPINEVATSEAAMGEGAAVGPFIELPHPTLAEGEPLDGVTITAMNVGARLGVMGAEIPVADAAAMQAALEDMTVRVTDAEGTEIGSAGGDAVLGHPVNSLLWLVGEGVALKAGDLVSVGSIGALMPPAKAGGKATVTYEGLPGDPSVSVTFR